MTRHAHHEDDLHMAVAQLLRLVLPADAIWSTIPAGGGGKIRGAKLKKMGYRAGWPDIEIVASGRPHVIELKTLTGTVSPVQRACHKALVRAGALVAVCRSIPDVEGTLRGWGLTRAWEAA